MKRITLLMIFAILMAANVSSQLRYGLRGGVNTAYFNAKDVITDENVRISTLNDATLGFHVGAMAQVNFLGMFIQPELLFSSIGSEVRVVDLEDDAVSRIRSQNYSKLDFPVLVGKRFGPARVGIGPVGTIMLSTNSELNELGYREKFNSATFGYQIGIGLDVLSRFALDVKYEGNLSRLGNGIMIGGQEQEFDLRSRQIILSVGIFL
ncbi:MAG: porin family protein [Bacteroidales bacterium]